MLKNKTFYITFHWKWTLTDYRAQLRCRTCCMFINFMPLPISSGEKYFITKPTKSFMITTMISLFLKITVKHLMKGLCKFCRWKLWSTLSIFAKKKIVLRNFVWWFFGGSLFVGIKTFLPFHRCRGHFENICNIKIWL